MPCASVVNSLAMRVLLFFIDNPAEELSAGDINVKFNTRNRHTWQQLRPLVELNLLERRPQRGVRCVYGAGPRLRNLAAACGATG